MFCSVSYYTVRVYWCEVARSHVYRLVSTAARVSSTRSRLDETEPTVVGSVSSRRSSRATPCARYLAPRTSHPPRVTFSPRRKIGVGGGFLFDFSGSILRVLRDSAPPLPKMLWPWRRGSGFVTATCHMHAACVYSPSTLGRSPTPLGRPGSFVGRGGPSSLGIHFGSRGSGHVSGCPSRGFRNEERPFAFWCKEC